MARGRKKDNPRDQRAKGYPGKRKKKTDLELERMVKAAERDAKLFALAGEGKDLQALPIFLTDPRLAPATVIWREYAPRLDKLHLLTTLDRHTFAMFCIYAAEFVLANRDILDKGYSLPVPTVAKDARGKPGVMLRDNPSVDRRDFAAKMMMDLAEKFGFTPHDRSKLIRDHAMQFDAETLFGHERQVPGQKAPPAPEGEDALEGGIGSLNTFDTPAPGKMN
jgi:P27 family predicted phage terminase small subunit